MYDNVASSILFVLSFGYRYEDILKMDICVFWELLDMIGKKYKAEKGIKD